MSNTPTWRAQLSNVDGPFLECHGTSREEAHFKAWDLWARTYGRMPVHRLTLLKSCSFNEPQAPEGIEFPEPEVKPEPTYPAAPQLDAEPAEES